MAEFLDLIESIPAPEATPGRLLPADGSRPAKGYGDRYPQKFAEAQRLLEKVVKGDRRAMIILQEAMSTSDFPLLFGDIISRAMVGAYHEYTPDILKVARKRVVPDFKSVRDFSLDGAEGVLSEVPQGTEYPEKVLSEGRDTWSVAKYGRRVSFLWETLVNNDLDNFRDIPNRLGKAARRTLAKKITQTYIDGSGPHATLYSSGNANKVTGNPTLTTAGLQTAMTVLGNMVDADSEPIMFDMAYLVVPPALAVTAMNILNALEIRIASEAGATANQVLHAQNWMKNRVELIVDPYIPIVATTANGATTWALFADPADARPALSYGLLAGHEEPELWVKAPNAVLAGGGPVSPEQGDFETDSTAQRVRFVCGAVRHTSTGGYKATVASNGSGS